MLQDVTALIQKICEQTASPIHLKYSPEQKATASTPKHAAHFDLLLDVLYPKTGDFVAIKGGRKM